MGEPKRIIDIEKRLDVLEMRNNNYSFDKKKRTIMQSLLRHSIAIFITLVIAVVYAVIMGVIGLYVPNEPSIKSIFLAISLMSGLVVGGLLALVYSLIVNY